MLRNVSQLLPEDDFWEAIMSRIDRKRLISLVPGRGFEPLTNGLQNRCSTAELTRLYWVFRASLATLASGLLAENRPACSFRWKVHKGRFQNFCRPGIGVPKKEIEDIILKDIQERPRPSGNFTADTNEAPAAACPSLAHHQARQLGEVHRGAGPDLLMRGGLLFFASAAALAFQAS
jgi:hypothetical protein